MNDLAGARPHAGAPHPPRAAPPRRPRTRWRQRWFRLVVPLVVLGLLVGVTLIARRLEEPNLRAAETLSPTGTGRDGSSELARMLTERGVRIDYVADIDEALAAGETGGDSVVFIPKPTIFGAILAALVPYFPGEHRVVMVAPSQRQLRIAGAPVVRDRPRWAASSAEPGCSVPEAVAAGRAAALRSRYQVADSRRVCYRGGLVQSELGYGLYTADMFVVGAADPFRNRRISEHHNAELAVELLAAHDRVIWAGALPLDLDFQMPRFPGVGRPQLPELDPPRRQELDRSPRNWLADLFYGYPSAVLVGLALAGLLAVLMALVRARRLGAPVPEPLPVLVPAAEVVAGRGRLYQRTRGRGVALGALRAGALRRLTPVLGLPAAPPPDPDTIVAAIAARTNLPADYVRHTLYGPTPETDEQLSQAVAALDMLVEAVTREGGAP